MPRREHTSKALGYGTRSQGSHSFTCTLRVHPLTEWTIPAFAFPAEAGTHLPTPEGWKAELAFQRITCNENNYDDGNRGQPLLKFQNSGTTLDKHYIFKVPLAHYSNFLQIVETVQALQSSYYCSSHTLQIQDHRQQIQAIFQEQIIVSEEFPGPSRRYY